jgi:hypothetical protein
VALRPAFKLGHTLEAGLFIHFRSLKVIARNPNPLNPSAASLNDESVQQRARATASPICLVNPHLLEFRSSCPCIASSDADHLSNLVADYKAQALAIMAFGCMTIVVVEAIFNCVDLIRREIVPGFYVKYRASKIVVMPP